MKTAVEFMASELLYLDNEYDMKLINKNEYQAKRKEIIEQANKIFEEQVTLSHINGQSEFDKGAYSENTKKLATEYYKETFKSE
jgi:hypothetical protein